MSLSRDTLLFGIALIVFGTWVELAGMGGWPFADAGIVVATIGFLASVVASMLSATETGAPAGEEPS